jgi:hypothetical protein
VNEYLRAYPEDEPIHFESVTYKPGTEILEESQPLALAVQLARAGRRIVIHESPAVIAVLRSQFGNLFVYEIRSAEDSSHPDPLQFAVRERSPAADPSSIEEKHVTRLRA